MTTWNAWNPRACTFEISYAFMKSLIYDSVVTCYKITDVVAKLYSDTSEIVLVNYNNNRYKNM